MLRADTSDATKRALVDSVDQVLGLDVLKEAAALDEKGGTPGSGVNLRSPPAAVVSGLSLLFCKSDLIK